jgi:NodT family efflux transporter outer membrane factor (OMF) lipoprotein
VRRSSRAASVGITFLALCGCTTVGPDFERPALPQGSAAVGYAGSADPRPRDVELIAARTGTTWWSAFGSEELDRTIRDAIAGNPSLAEAEGALQRAIADLAAARGGTLPQADIQGGARKARINTASFGFTGFPNRSVDLYSIGAGVTYDLDLFGAGRRGVEAADARVEAARQRAEAAYLSLTGNVALQMLRVAALRAEIQEVRRIVDADRRIIRMIQEAQAAGGAARRDLSATVAQLAEDEALLPPLERQLAAARHQVALLVGQPPAADRIRDLDLSSLTAPPRAPLALPSELVRLRPDILAAEADLHAATAAVGVARANQFPHILLSPSFTQTAVSPGDVFASSAAGWNLGATLTAPLFDGGRLKARRQAAEAELRIAESRYQQTVLRAFVQVSDVLASLASDEIGIESLQRAVEAGESGLRDAETAFGLGGGPLIDVTRAQRTLSRARRAMIQIQGQRYLDLVELHIATAADWRASP